MVAAAEAVEVEATEVAEWVVVEAAATVSNQLQ